ncbi:uncharacterized protein LOC120892613 [Ictidomys tridecemlineatus]
MNENKLSRGARPPPREAAAAFKVAAPSPAAPAPRPGRPRPRRAPGRPDTRGARCGHGPPPAPVPSRPAPAAHSPRPERRRGPSPCGPARVPVRAAGGAASTAAGRTRGHRPSRGASARPRRPAERPLRPPSGRRARLSRDLSRLACAPRLSSIHLRLLSCSLVREPAEEVPSLALSEPRERELARGGEACAPGAARLPPLPAGQAGRGGSGRVDPRRGLGGPRPVGEGLPPPLGGERSEVRGPSQGEVGGRRPGPRAGRGAPPIPHAGQWAPRPGSRGPGRSASPGQRSLPVLRPSGSTVKRLPQMITEKHVSLPSLRALGRARARRRPARPRPQPSHVPAPGD